MTMQMCRVCAVVAWWAVMAAVTQAQAPGASSPLPEQTDVTKLDIKTTRLASNFYVLEGLNCSSRRLSSCGAVGALVGPDGVLLVDSGSFPELTGKIVAEIRKITDGPIRFMINTHFHGDHTAGNENAGKMGVLIFAREELRRRLAVPAPGPAGGPTPPAPPAVALPMVTYQGRMTIHMNGDRVEAIPIPVAHTDGDTLVYFPVADVVMTGDYFRNLGFPDMNRPHGGTLKGMLDGLGVLIGLAGPNTKVVPGHGPITDRARVMEFRDMILAVRDRVAKLMQEGKTADQVVAAQPHAEYLKRIVPSPGGSGGAEAFIRQLYAELQGAGSDR